MEQRLNRSDQDLMQLNQRRSRVRSSSPQQKVIRHTNSSTDLESVTSVQLGNTSHWGPGQEYSRFQAYDPVQDILQGRKYASERKELSFREIFRFAKCFDWLLMIIGIILAVLGSLVTPWLYYWAGVALHDILIFETCEPKTTIDINGKQVCDSDNIPSYCNLKLSTVGQYLLYNILLGWLAYNCFQFGYCICFTLAADRQTKSMRTTYFESVVRKDMAWFDLYAGKDFAKEMTDQITSIRLGIGEVIPNFVNLVCTVTAMTVIVFLLNYKAAVAFLSFIPVSLICVFMGNWAEKKRTCFSDKMFEKAYLVARESFVNIKVIKMYEAERRQTLKFRNSLNNDTKDGRRNSRHEVIWMAVAALSSGSVWLLLNIATALVFWNGQGKFRNASAFCDWQKNRGVLSPHPYYDHITNSNLDLAGSPGEILLVYFGLMYITLHAIEVPSYLSLMKVAKNSATGVFFIIDWKSRIDNVSNEGKTPKRSAVGRLDFAKVTFRYPQKPDLTVLNIRQLTIYSGQFVAFAGPADSGKNTILKLIPRLYDCCSGFITLDAVNLQNYNIHWLRRQMCVISEAPVIFSGTISENILFGKMDATDAEIVNACQLAEIHQVIMNLPHGYNTKISGKEFGDDLTRDEKRQLCLARAYLHRSRVILLDNPLQPEDDGLEGLLLRFVESFRDSATVILASTNVTALSKRADMIYYMEHGRIVESGSHIQLIQARGRYYNRLEGTINCSTESRNKFESQLKAYKFSQLLQKKRKSSGLVDSSWEENFSDMGGGDEPKKPRKRLWSTIFKSLSSGSKQTLKRSERLSEGEDAYDVEEGVEGSSKLGSRKKNVEISNLEEAYNQYIGGRSRRSVDGYMHQGFGMMGFQRMNFARPMTNYSSQLVNQRNTFISHFPNNGRQSLNLNAFRDRKLSHLRDASSSNESLSPVNERSGRTRVKFSFDIPDPNIHDHSKGHPPSKQKTKKKDNKTGKHRVVINDESKTKETTQAKKSIIKTKAVKQGGGGSSHSSKHHHNKGKVDNVSKSKSKLSKMGPSLSHLKLPTDRDSIQDALKNMTNPASFHLNERVEIDNVSVQTEELDSFLAEYDEGIYSTMNSQVKGYWRDIFFVVKHDWLYIVPAMIASVILGLSIPYQIWIVGTFFQAIGTQRMNEEEKANEVDHLAGFMVTAGLVTALAAFIQEWLFALAGRRMTCFSREKLFSHILTQDLEWFDAKAHDVGILTFQLYADTMTVQHILLMCYGIVIQGIFCVATSVTFAVIESLDETLAVTLFFVAAVPIQIGVVYLSSKMVLEKTKGLEKRFKVAGDFAQEFLINLKTWFSLGADGYFISHHEKILQREYKFVRSSSIIISCLHCAVHTSSWLLYGIFVYFTLINIDENKLRENRSINFRGKHQYPSPFTKSTLIGFVTIATELLIFGAVRVGDQIAVLTDVEFGKTAAHKMMRILMNIPETDPPSKIKTISDEIREEDFYKPPPEIGLTNISYYFPGTDQSSQEGHLRGVSMTIASSSYVAIVGPPGSGKSALCNIILRMYNPTSGILDFNGDDSFHLSPKVTRRLMGLVEYDPCLFDCSIFENIRYGKPRSSEGDEEDEADKVEVEEATKLCNCHFDILDLPEDYNSLVDQLDKTAHNFSLKQRISYSRALLKKPQILVIDDATTSVDVETDHKILQVLANVRENRTLIVFSHKIEPVRDADTIFVLWEGEIVESGVDSFLLAKKGYYYEMYMTQKVLQESMRNSPQQLNTIRYNIKKQERSSVSPINSTKIIAEITSKPKSPHRKSSIAFVKFLDEKVNKMKQEKEERRMQIVNELPTLEMEEKRRELLKEEKRKKSDERKAS